MLLIGAPLTAGFWKSFVEVEKGNRWIWDDRGFAEKLRQTITAQIGHRFGAILDMDVDHADESAEALARLRGGEPLHDLEESIGEGELVVSSVFSVSTGMQLIAADVGFHLESVVGRQDFVTRYFVETEGPLERESLETWVSRSKELLAENGLNLVVTSFRQWRLPDTEELHRPAWISGASVPDFLGPSLMERAVAKFRDGATEEAAAAFLRMLSDREAAQVRNNLAFCQILLGKLPGGSRECGKGITHGIQSSVRVKQGGRTGASRRTNSSLAIASACP